MNARSSKSRSGFTLIEMIITLCVFILLAGAIFSIFGATLQGATTLQDDQTRSDQTEALGAWLRESFLSLPAEGMLISYHRESDAFHVSGVIWDAGDQLRALDLQQEANGNYLLRLAVGPETLAGTGPDIAGQTGTASYTAALVKFRTAVFNDDASLPWRILVRELKSADWRFRAANSVTWMDSSSAGKPLLAEFTFQPAGSDQPIVDDFWIPPVQAPNMGLAAPAVAAPAATNL